MRRLSGGCLLLSSCLPLAVPARAQPVSATTTQTPADAPCAPNSLACHRIHVDHDGRLDRVELLHHRAARLYEVSIHLATGRYHVPWAAPYDPADTIALTPREGPGDIRCRRWAPGRTCGFPVPAHASGRGLFLSHSRQGDFVMIFGFPHDYRTTAPDGGPRTDGWVQVMPALDGPNREGPPRDPRAPR